MRAPIRRSFVYSCQNELRIFRFLWTWILALLLLSAGSTLAGLDPLPSTGPTLINPILFVTQVPIPADFTTIGSVFGNHRATMLSTRRGGDLWIRYPHGTRKNLTAAAGYGNEDFQGVNAIAVRDPSVHWDGSKAVFSMVVGARTEQYEILEFRWQLYEIIGLGQEDSPEITKILGQPETANNVGPIYGTDDAIFFTSDYPRNGAVHLYP